jgi:hypothetical protein
LNQGGHGGRLSRSGIAANHEAAFGLRAHQKSPQSMEQRSLTRGWGVGEGRPQSVFYIVGQWRVVHARGQSNGLRGGGTGGIP